MNPDLVKKLREISEVRQLIEFIAQEINRLDSLEGIEDSYLGQAAAQIDGKKRAKKTLENILGPLLEDVAPRHEGMNKEYIA